MENEHEAPAQAADVTAADTQAAEAAGTQAAESPLVHKRGPKSGGRRGVLCMPETHGQIYDRGCEPWSGTIARVASLATCPDCLALGRQAEAEEAAAEEAQQKVGKAESARAQAEAGEARARAEAEAARAEAEATAAAAAGMGPEVLDVLAQDMGDMMAMGIVWLTARAVKADMGKAMEAASGKLESSGRAWAAYLKYLMIKNGGTLPPWALPIMASVPCAMAAATAAGTAKGAS